MSDRPTGIASCALCRFRAQMTADTDADVRDTLTRILVAHLTTEHPDEHADPDGPSLLVYRGFEPRATGGRHG